MNMLSSGSNHLSLDHVTFWQETDPELIKWQMESVDMKAYG